MKKILVALLTLSALMCGSDAFAQGKWGADSAECIKYLSYYKEYYKQKAYDEALPNWRQAYKLCPASAQQSLLVDGASLMRRLITKTKDAELRNAIIDSLLVLHDQRAEHFPKYAVTALNNKGLDLSNYVKNNPAKLYEGFEAIINATKEETKVNILLFNLQSAIEYYQEGGIQAEEVINVYQRNTEIINAITPKNDIEGEQIEKVKTDMGSLFAASKVASCENLIELFTPRLAADPDNLELASNIVKTMSLTDGCVDNDLYLNAVTTMYRLEPSANSAYYLYKLNSGRNNVDDAIKYMEEAISREDSDANTDVEWTYELATYCFKNGMSPKAFECANTVAASGSATLTGKAYFLIGTIWGSTRCGGDEISTRAPYWVACDYMNKAKAADETLTDSANEYIREYSKYFPQAAEAFMYDITNGQSYTVVCGGMRATTTVRTVK